ncbi:hypothetical protein J7F03_05795 [Streptomyces sp. ISL-43]|uniref:hypothetical protein n=1 Tax=Streptomyces sp. ISL-43 TaxID=2819183 RepID=UPI001BEB730C|nr:hypothetical protein [Streptomyces sp. ISL-43]MBT2446602.1 hypothetical protein [Streptomyces sp. ISL-43]
MNLVALGLQPETDTLYEDLLAHPGLPPEDAVERLGWELSVLDHALVELLDHGLVVLTDDRRTVPTDPAVALELLVAQRTSELARRVALVDSVRSAIPALHRIWSYDRGHRRPAVTGPGKRFDRYSYLAYREVLVIHPPGPLTRGHMAAALPVHRRLLRRGVSLRKIVAPEAHADPDSNRYLGELAALGADIRLHRVVTPHTLLIDGAIALICGDQVSTSRAKNRVQALTDEFERFWHIAEPFAATADKSPPLR